MKNDIARSTIMGNTCLTNCCTGNVCHTRLGYTIVIMKFDNSLVN